MYTNYDNPGEFFNLAPTTGAYSLTSASITLGCGDHATPANRFIANLSASQAALTTGSTAQVVFGLVDAIYQRFNDIKILAAANAPTKFNIQRNGFTDETTGELVYNYNISIRVNPTGLVAVNQ